ncbi:MAG: hypothetical protein M1815_002932 [Lichina confinis]|nr:MAG: hypothetical protein M1815_002932 [Lichina confinis]
MVFPPKAAGSWFLLPPSQAEVRQRGLRWLPGTLAVEAEGEAEIRRTDIAALSESSYGTSYLASTNQLGIMAPYGRPDPEARRILVARHGDITSGEGYAESRHRFDKATLPDDFVASVPGAVLEHD